jgi:hypothetical protein
MIRRMATGTTNQQALSLPLDKFGQEASALRTLAIYLNTPGSGLQCSLRRAFMPPALQFGQVRVPCPDARFSLEFASTSR